MKKSKTFQIVLIGIFVAFILLGVLGFAGFLPLPGGKDNKKVSSYGTVTVWGTIPEDFFTVLLKNTFAGKNAQVNIQYFEKREDRFDQDLLEALATGRAPDVILLPDNLILRQRDKIYPLSYETWSQRTFRDTFIDGADVYLDSKGILALPFVVDPLIMFWNKDIFQSSFIASPPSTWKEVREIGARLTMRRQEADISQSGIALGEYRNIAYAKEILVTLLLQTGNPLVRIEREETSRERLVSTLADGFELPVPPAISVLQFYTQFSNPVKETYTWNRALPYSQDMFTVGNLAMYFGFASEMAELRKRNPRLNLDVAMIPQATAGDIELSASKPVTFTRMYGLAALKSSKNMNGAIFVTGTLAKKDFVESFLKQNTGFTPARKDILKVRPTDIYLSVFYNSAIIGKSWLDPSPLETDRMFQEAIEDIMSGRRKIVEAVTAADKRLNDLLK